MKPFTLFITACIILFTSCQKELSESSPESPSQSFKIKSYTETLSNGSTSITDTFNVSYYPDGKLKTVESVGFSGSRMVYTHGQNQFHMEIFIGNKLSLHEDFYLNAFSLMDSSFQYNDTHDTTTEKYIYNSARQLTERKMYVYKKATGAILDNVTTYQYDIEGNVIKEEDQFKVTTYEYYPDLKSSPLGLAPYYYQSPKLVKTTTNISGGFKTVYNHTYVFDSQNRLISEKMTDNDSKISVIRTYNY